MLERLSLRLRVLLIFAGFGAGAVVVVLAGLAAGYSRMPDAGSVNALVQAGVIATFGIFAIVPLTCYLFDLTWQSPSLALRDLCGRAPCQCGARNRSARRPLSG
jgi:DNA polymerase-3 subunit epsilon